MTGSLLHLVNLCYRKYRILCILITALSEKENVRRNIYTELRFDRWVEDGRLVFPVEIALVLWRIFLVVVTLSSCGRADMLYYPVVLKRLSPFLGHERLQLQLITWLLGCTTSSLVNKSSKFIPFCHNQLVMIYTQKGLRHDTVHEVLVYCI